MRISDWSSDVCSSDLQEVRVPAGGGAERLRPCRNAPERDRFRRSALGREGFTRAPLSLPVAPSSRPSALLRNLPRRQNRHHRPMDIYLVGGGVRERLLGRAPGENGRASCRERVWQYGEISVVAVSIQKKKTVQKRDSITISKE